MPGREAEAMDSYEMLDYVLGQLEDQERERLENEVASNPMLAVKLERLARCVRRLLDDNDAMATVPSTPHFRFGLVACDDQPTNLHGAEMVGSRAFQRRI